MADVEVNNLLAGQAIAIAFAIDSSSFTKLALSIDMSATLDSQRPSVRAHSLPFGHESVSCDKR